MSDYKIGIEVTIDTMDDPVATESLAETLCDVIRAVVVGMPNVADCGGIDYEITEADKEASFATKISEYGNSLAINVTKHAPGIGIQKGDRVAVTVRKIAGGTKE